jgi:hypothetical protein
MAIVLVAIAVHESLTPGNPCQKKMHCKPATNSHCFGSSGRIKHPAEADLLQAVT